MILMARAIRSLRPNTEWTLGGKDVENIIWYTKNVEPLTIEDVKSEMMRLEKADAEEAQAKIDAKKSAVDKLANLGLTPEEVKELFGIEI